MASWPLASPSWPSSSSSRPIGSVPAPTRSVWAATALEACRDKGGLVGGEGVGVGVLYAPEAAGTSTTIVLQPSLRCAGFMLKISNLPPKQLLQRCGRRAAVGRDGRRGRLHRARALEHHESSGPGVKDRSRSLNSARRGPPNEKVMRIPATHYGARAVAASGCVNTTSR